jgi:predicted AAA+ superfamily ATPase
MLENLAAVELLRRRSMDEELDFFYWKGPSDREVDFIVTRKGKAVEAIQVCLAASDLQTVEREEKALFQALAEFGLKTGTVLSMSRTAEVRKNGLRILWTPMWKWLLDTKRKPY